MRYDGYYILSDLWDVTNLGGRRPLLARIAGSICLGLKTDDDDPLGVRHGRPWLAAYAVAAAVYRWMVFFGILWFFNKFFEPYRLDFIGQTLGLLAVAGIVMVPIRAGRQFFSVPGRIHLVNKNRLSATLGVAAA
ncbi:MAG: hypothetical protein QM775_30420 [Pirellulales bacterium]